MLNIIFGSPFIAILLIVLIFIVIITTGYVKAPPDTAFIISGFNVF